MIKLERTQVMGLEPAIRGMRNPMNSWDKSDSGYGCGLSDRHFCGVCESGHDNSCPNRFQDFVIGPNDHGLAMRLIKGGPVEAKFRRQIFVSVDITAPLYWWKEFDTYKVGTVANSCSTMHKIHAKEFVLGDFSCERLRTRQSRDVLRDTIITLNILRDVYMNGGVLYSEIGDTHTSELVIYAPKSKDIWYEMIQLLPTSYNQMRTITFNYEVLASMYKSRKNHKLQEWRDLCEWMLALPYPEFITGKVSEE